MYPDKKCCWSSCWVLSSGRRWHHGVVVFLRVFKSRPAVRIWWPGTEKSPLTSRRGVSAGGHQIINSFWTARFQVLGGIITYPCMYICLGKNSEIYYPAHYRNERNFHPKTTFGCVATHNPAIIMEDTQSFIQKPPQIDRCRRRLPLNRPWTLAHRCSSCPFRVPSREDVLLSLLLVCKFLSFISQKKI